MSIKIYKSPGAEPLAPASPSPVMRLRLPLSTPDGTFTESFLLLFTLPCPLHGRHGSPSVSHTPQAEAHVLSIVKNPC